LIPSQSLLLVRASVTLARCQHSFRPRCPPRIVRPHPLRGRFSGHALAPGLLIKPRAPFAMVVQCPGRDGGPSARTRYPASRSRSIPSGLRFVRVALKASGVEIVRQPDNAPTQLPPRPREQHKVAHVACIKIVLLVQAGEVAVDVVQQCSPDEGAQGADARYAGHRRMYLNAILHDVVRVLRHQVPAHRVSDPVVYHAGQRCFPDVCVNERRFRP